MTESNVLKICAADELEHYTSSGWQLQEVLQGSSVHPLTYQEQAEKTEDNNYSGYYDRTVSLTRDAVLIEHHFLLRKSATAINAELQVANSKLHEEIRALERRETDLKSEHDKIVAAKKAMQDRIDSDTSRYNSLYQQFEQQTAAKRKMEGDIAKIRKEIGEAAMKKILDPEA